MHVHMHVRMWAHIAGYIASWLPLRDAQWATGNVLLQCVDNNGVMQV